MARKLFLTLFVLLLSVFMVTPAQAAKTYHAERFDVQLDLQANGVMLVTETVEFRFEGGPFTYVFREIARDGTDNITFLEASLDGVTLPLGAEAGQVEVDHGDPLKVTWHFAPTSDAAHVFVVRYRVEGVITTGDADRLRWYVIPPDHGYPITKSTITLNYWNNVQPFGTPSLDRSFDSTQTDTGVRLTTSGVADDESVILTATFPSGSLAQTAPLWQAREQRESAAFAQVFPIALLSGLATLFLGGLGLFSYVRANQREVNPPAPMLLTSPPADLPPAVVGKLTGMANSFMGALFDLAQRGLLEIREEKGIWGTTKHILERKPVELSLNAYEQALLDLVFKPGETRIDLTEVGNRLAYGTSTFDQPLEQELIQRGWLDPQRKQKRAVLVAVSLLVLFVGLALFLGGLIATGALLSGNLLLSMVAAALTGLSGGAFVLSIPMLIYAGNYSVLTPSGEEQKTRWNAFRAYLDQVSRGKEPAIRPDLFERYLALAVVFGLGSAWSKYFQELGGVPLPIWFHALAGSNGDFSSIVAVMTTSDAAAYSSADGGGGGASGGGSSGAG